MEWKHTAKNNPLDTNYKSIKGELTLQWSIRQKEFQQSKFGLMTLQKGNPMKVETTATGVRKERRKCVGSENR